MTFQQKLEESEGVRMWIYGGRKFQAERVSVKSLERERAGCSRKPARGARLMQRSRGGEQGGRQTGREELGQAGPCGPLSGLQLLV